jgi:hypothetical protein
VKKRKATGEPTLAELMSDSQVPTDVVGYTAKEVAAAMGVTRWKACELLGRMVADGRAVPVIVIRRTLWGVPRRTCGYADAPR